LNHARKTVLKYYTKNSRGAKDFCTGNTDKNAPLWGAF